jgi:sigma-B regulation protein RsbU (phosphoserine phosphatase)
MQVKSLDRIRRGLVEKRDHLATWLDTVPKNKLRENLGSSDPEKVQERLAAMDEAIEESEAGTLGVCTVCHDYVNTRLLEMDYTACICLDHYSDEEKRDLEYELELAQDIHRALLTHHDWDIPGVELAAFSRPAQILGGDYFDFLRFQDGSYALVIADIAGHGVSAGLYMASLQTALRMLIPICSSPAEVITKIHHLYNHNIYFNTFVTLFLAAFDPASSSLTYINAGHNPPLLLCRSNLDGCSTDWLRLTGAAIGLVEEPEFETVTVPLHPGDLLILYTDGFTEAMNQKDTFGTERLANYACQSIDLPAQGLVHSLWQHLVDYTHGIPLSDDTTIVAMKMAVV